MTSIREVAEAHTHNVLSFGAGVQSTTLLLMSCLGELPKLDAAIFADTQWEPAAVYRHLEWCQEFAADHGITVHVRTAGNIRQDILDFWRQRKSADGRRHASIPVFIANPDGTVGIARRQCTRIYKIDVIDRFIRREIVRLSHGQRWPAGVTCRSWIGISTDEAHRMGGPSQSTGIIKWHPLIEAEECQAVRDSLCPIGMSRQDCIDWLTGHGFPVPPKSACIGCPFRSDREWAALTPEEFADAAALDRDIRRADSARVGDLVGKPYLHRSLVPLSDVVFRDAAGHWGNECGGACGV